MTAGWGVLIYTGTIDTIWPMFGIANQLLAVIALALVTTMLVNSGRGRYAPVTLLPMLFVASTTMTAGVLVSRQFPAMYSAGQPLKATLCIALTVLVMACVMTLLLMAAARWVVVTGGSGCRLEPPAPQDSRVAAKQGSTGLLAMPDIYKTVIGLEVHVQLLTRTKLFCGCSTKFGLPPNSATCPVCIGMPGVLPVMNRSAFDLALKAALALNCEIAPFTKWDRKNYYYPDLAEELSDQPVRSAVLHRLADVEIRRPQRIGIIRVHLEEDAGKMMHDEAAARKVDLNRTGTPLLEIVTEPDIRSPEEAVAYLEELRLMLRELGVSDCEMQEGRLRCDANVNVHIPRAGDHPTPIVEVKNLNSFRAVERAINTKPNGNSRSSQRRARSFGEVPKATAGWDDARRRHGHSTPQGGSQRLSLFS